MACKDKQGSLFCDQMVQGKVCRHSRRTICWGFWILLLGDFALFTPADMYYVISLKS